MSGTYPDAPGWKGEAETGRESANEMRDKLGRLQKMVREAANARGKYGITAEEAADLIGVDRVSAQPRLSELKAKGLLVDSGRRRRNPSSGKSAVVWVSPCYATEREDAA